MTEKELEKLYKEAYKAVYWTDLSILKIYTIATCSDIVKCFLSIIFLKKLNWAQNIVSTENA